MPKTVVSYVRHVESMNVWLGKILSVGGILGLLGIMLVEIVGRYIFNRPFPWTIELSMFVMGTYFLFCGGYILLRGGHVRMDALYSRWSPRRRAIADLATFSCLAIYLAVFLWGGIDQIAYSLEFNIHSHSMWGPPTAPIQIIIVVGVVLLFVEGIVFFIRDLSILRGKPIE